MRFPGFIGPSYTSQSVNVDCQRCVNLFPEINALGTGKEREVACLVPTPGLRLLGTIGDGPIRGAYAASNGQLFVVSANKLYRVSSAWSGTELGSLNTSSGPVSMADNGTYLMLVDGTDGFTWNIDTSTYAEITDEDFYPADQVTYQDGYFLLNRKDTGQLFFTELNSVSFDGLDIASAEGSPDNLVGIISHSQNVYLFGTRSTEVFYNTGEADSTFQRIQGAISDVGCAAVFSIAKGGGSLFFLGGDDTGIGIVYQMQGYQPQRISTYAIEGVIRGLTSEQVAAARAWTYQQGGHIFYCLNLPGHNATWCYDASTGLWHERTYRDLWDLERHRADCHALAYGQNVVGDYENGKIYALDQDKYSDDGTAIIRMRRAPHFSEGMKSIRHNRFDLDMETGVGLDGTGQGTDPKVMMRYSDDGGHTWSNPREAGIGKIGEKKKRAFWNRLGSSRDRVYEVSVSDPVKTVFIGAELAVEGGSS